ncbi:SigE family RNA polymerase sigma factor [Catellatospora tritici]|uniref:SigE family RNA polymerase sigma factor n=1 Tax=Catellatospora tritici TaxID=2851566 RepID=UPI001C2D3D8A|nr:SigE family RNA polymerase sigma factor [Catellatospora tritici]MBV1855163.1 SigE family RNA polymerase sigma factor [Catellatospora tritici]
MDRYDGFHEFVVARGGALSRTAFLLAGEHHTAEDLVQTALAKAAARWRHIVAHGEPEAYIRRIMVNERITWWRRRPARPVAHVPERAGPDEPHHIVERIALGQALDTLTPRQRAVVVLRFYEDLSEAETAAALGCSIGTVKSQTHVALNHLRRALPLYAEQAGQYADADAAMAAARKRRVRWVAATATLVVLPVVIAVTVFTTRQPSPPPTTPAPPSPTASLLRTAPGAPPLPEALPSAGQTLPSLPADRGVGRVSLLRAQRFADGGTNLQLATAAGWYGMRIAAESPDLLLSPDGRWLAWTGADHRTVLRDLTGTTQRSLPAFPIAFAPAGEWAVISGSPGSHQVLSLSDFTSSQFDTPGRWTDVHGVLDTGEVVLGDGWEPGPQQFGLTVLDPRTGRSHKVRVDLTSALRAKQDVRDFNARPKVVPISDHTAAVLAYGQEEGVALVEFSLLDGTVLRHVELAAQAPSTTAVPVACLRGRDQIWYDRGVLRRTGPGGDAGALTLRHDGFGTFLGGCRREVPYPE